jgi:hypothetical protein
VELEELETPDLQELLAQLAQSVKQGLLDTQARLDR